MRSNREYKDEALRRLNVNWGPFVMASLIYLALCATGVTVILALLVVFPFCVGYMNSMRLFVERDDRDIMANLAQISISNYLHKVAGMGFMVLKIFLWTLLFVIPGAVMTLAYVMTPFILEEYPELSAWEASSRSRELMQGHKFDYLCLLLSFLGWILLGIVTFGIGFLWVYPYIVAATVGFYDDLKREKGWYQSPEWQ